MTSLYSRDIFFFIFFFLFFIFFYFFFFFIYFFFFYFSGLSNRIMREILSHWRLEPVYPSGCTFAYVDPAIYTVSNCTGATTIVDIQANHVSMLLWHILRDILCQHKMHILCTDAASYQPGNLLRNKIVCSFTLLLHSRV